MSRIFAPDTDAPSAHVPEDCDSEDSDESGDGGGGGGGMRIAADPTPDKLPRAAFAQRAEALGTSSVGASTLAPSQPVDSSFAAPAPPKFAVPPRKKSAGEFIASSQFTGPKPGFIYKKGPDGLGYYKDENFAQNNIGTGLGNASREGSGLPAPQSSAARDMLNMLKAKEFEENSKPKSNTIPVDEDSDSDEDSPIRPPLASSGGGMFSKLTKKISRSADEIRANIQKRKAADPESSSSGSQIGPVPTEKPDTPRPSIPSRPNEVAAPPAFDQPAPILQRPATPQRQNVTPALPTRAPAPALVANGTQQKIQRQAPDSLIDIICEDLGFGMPQSVMGLDGFSNIVRVGNMLFTSSHGPQLPTQGFVRGRVGEGGMTIESAQVAASLTTLSVLKSLSEELGGLNSIKGIVKITAQVAVVDEKASSDLVAIFGPMRDVLKAIFSCNQPVISVSGVSCLPHEIPLQAEFVFELQ